METSELNQKIKELLHETANLDYCTSYDAVCHALGDTVAFSSVPTTDAHKMKSGGKFYAIIADTLVADVRHVTAYDNDRRKALALALYEWLLLQQAADF